MKLRHISFRTQSDSYQKRMYFGIINEFFGRIVVSSDSERYNFPFLHKCNTERTKSEIWTDNKGLYEYKKEELKNESDITFDIGYEMVRTIIQADSVFYDVGCNSGYFLDKFRNKGHGAI